MMTYMVAETTVSSHRPISFSLWDTPHFPASHTEGWNHMVESWPTGWSQAEGMPFLDTTTLPYKVDRAQTQKGRGAPEHCISPVGRRELPCNCWVEKDVHVKSWCEAGGSFTCSPSSDLRQVPLGRGTLSLSWKTLWTILLLGAGPLWKRHHTQAA